MTDLATRLHLSRAAAARRGRPRDERGDVPGWVLVTLMSALLVVALLAVAQERLVAMFEQAMDSIR